MDTVIALPSKEVEQTNKQILALQDTALSLVLKSPADLEIAAEFLGRVKSVESVVVSRREEITRPIMSGLASIRDLFKPLEAGLKNAKEIVKTKVAAYQTAEEERIDAERARIAARVKKGTLRVDTALKKLDSVGEIQKKVGKMQTRKITKVRIMDETMIPREYLVPNMTKITEAVLRGGIDVPGVEKYTEKVIAV